MSEVKAILKKARISAPEIVDSPRSRRIMEESKRLIRMYGRKKPEMAHR